MGGTPHQSYVLYHGPGCADGWGAAFSAHQVLADSAAYLAVQYGDPLPDIPDLSRVFILDFSYDAGTLIGLAQRCELVVVRDHHKSAREALEGLVNRKPGTIPNLDVVFDMEKSGAVLAWEYFCPTEPTPALLFYIQDRDIWQWRLPGSRAVSAGLSVEPRTFDRWSQLSRDFEEMSENFTLLTRRGAAILAAQAVHIDSLASKAILVTVGGYEGIPAVNSPIFQSEIGERLCELHPTADFAAVWFALDLDREVWSLRSRNGFDVSAVAKQLQGGGHPGAAGFARVRGDSKVSMGRA